MHRLPAGIVFLAALTLVGACESDAPATPDSPIDVSLVLAPGETRAVAGTSLQLQFQGVLGDSRCPADALCIQGGDAMVRIHVLSNGAAPAAYDLHTGNLQPARHDSVTIALVNLSPYPFSSRPINPDDYRATLRVTR